MFVATYDKITATAGKWAFVHGVLFEKVFSLFGKILARKNIFGVGLQCVVIL